MLITNRVREFSGGSLSSLCRALTSSLVLFKFHSRYGPENVATKGTEQSFDTGTAILKLLDGLMDFGVKHGACLTLILVSLTRGGLTP